MNIRLAAAAAAAAAAPGCCTDRVASAQKLNAQCLMLNAQCQLATATPAAGCVRWAGRALGN